MSFSDLVEKENKKFTKKKIKYKKISSKSNQSSIVCRSENYNLSEELKIEINLDECKNSEEHKSDNHIQSIGKKRRPKRVIASGKEIGASLIYSQFERD
jgi:hypothetical protein